MNSERRIGLTASVLVTLAACLSHPARAQASPAACTLLTQAEVTAALGMSVADGKHIGVNSCQWAVTPPTSPATMATLQMTTSAAYKGAQNTLLPEGASRTAVSGVGDHAIYLDMKSFAMLTAEKGRSTFVVRIYGVKDAAARMSAAKKLAQVAAGRL